MTNRTDHWRSNSEKSNGGPTELSGTLGSPPGHIDDRLNRPTSARGATKSAVVSQAEIDCRLQTGHPAVAVEERAEPFRQAKTFGG
jgi:hypothetical protein